jgi:cytochrome c oxidase assembly factor CtaG
MQASLLEILREIPGHRRREGKRFDLATVLLYAILAMVAGANSYASPAPLITDFLAPIERNGAVLMNPFYDPRQNQKR